MVAHAVLVVAMAMTTNIQHNGYCMAPEMVTVIMVLIELQALVCDPSTLFILQLTQGLMYAELGPNSQDLKIQRPPSGDNVGVQYSS